MSICVVWIDRENAKLFEFSHEKMERRNLQSTHVDHHTHRFDAIEQRQREQTLFSELVTHVSEAPKLLILGPGVAKHRFQNYLTEHFPALAKKVVACEAMDHPTDSQIAAFARRYFNLPTPERF